MVTIIAIILIITGIFIFLRNKKNDQQGEDILLIEFQYKIMIYMLIGGGIVVLVRELILFIF